MTLFKKLVAAVGLSMLLVAPAFAAEKTCCEKAKADGKACSHKCCIAAKKDGKTCEKCNPKQKPDPNKTSGQNK